MIQQGAEVAKKELLHTSSVLMALCMCKLSDACDRGGWKKMKEMTITTTTTSSTITTTRKTTSLGVVDQQVP